MRDYNTYLEIPSIVSDLLSYDALDGSIKWVSVPREMFKSERAWKSVKTKKLGKRAELKHAAGYYRIFLLGDSYLAHRVAIFMHYGDCPTDWQIDHINGNKRDNRISNLRIAKPTDQMRNIGRAKNNTSGFTGVTWDKDRKKWAASIKFEGKKYHLGRFPRLESAIEARKNANIQFGFHENHGKVR